MRRSRQANGLRVRSARIAHPVLLLKIAGKIAAAKIVETIVETVAVVQIVAGRAVAEESVEAGKPAGVRAAGVPSRVLLRLSSKS
jgi:hypothetical protein